MLNMLCELPAKERIIENEGKTYSSLRNLF